MGYIRMSKAECRDATYEWLNDQPLESLTKQIIEWLNANPRQLEDFEDWYVDQLENQGDDYEG